MTDGGLVTTTGGLVANERHVPVAALQRECT